MDKESSSRSNISCCFLKRAFLRAAGAASVVFMREKLRAVRELCFRFPESMKIAVLINCDQLFTVSEEELCFWFIFWSKENGSGFRNLSRSGSTGYSVFPSSDVPQSRLLRKLYFRFTSKAGTCFSCAPSEVPGISSVIFSPQQTTGTPESFIFVMNILAVIADIEFYAHRGPPCE